MATTKKHRRSSGLKPWRDVVLPHPDVSSGRYTQAEFAADLAQVLSGNAELEYQDPVEFFERTYLTEGMTQLLTASVERLTGRGGEPVVQLKTAFGGGKTHTMLALYHLVAGKQTAETLQGVPEILKAARADGLPQASVAVLVGTALDPSKPHKTKRVRGKSICTLWGEMAAQIGGGKGFELVQDADAKGVSPGGDTLVELFERFGPCVILIDELVAYGRNVYNTDGLPSGSFDSIMTFVQSLTEAVRRSKNSVLLVAVPESKMEIGGKGGRETVQRLEHTLGRMEAVWKPVGATEAFEVVRRRLFRPVEDESARDNVCRAFMNMYEESPAEFPPECREGTYLDRLRSTYPFHPEIFDRLYEDWASLERFQRTRGVLRFAAATIHELWTRKDNSLMILPGSVPLDAPKVRDELTRYLSEGWNSVVDRDIDGDRSEPLQIDKANPRMGRLMAARRVARTIFLGSAPSVREQRVRGIEDVRVRLGVAEPGTEVSVYNDALGRLAARLTHLYASNGRYWYDLPPNLRRTVADRAERLKGKPELVEDEIVRRLRAVRERGCFRAVHICMPSSDIPDEQEARLVVLPVEAGHAKGGRDPRALGAAAEIFEMRGNSPRNHRNMLVFVAADADSVPALEESVRLYLAWKSVVNDADTLNLDGSQRKDAAENERKGDETVDVRLNEAYCWLLVPTQEGTGPVEWETTRISGNETPVGKASKKVQSSEQLIVRWSPAGLKIELDKWLWKDVPHVGVRKVWDDLCRYCYFPRLKDPEVFLDAIRDGLRSRDFFGYAASVGEDGRYQGLQFGQAGASIYLDPHSVLVKPDAALKQLAEDAQKAKVVAEDGVGVEPSVGTGGPEDKKPEDEVRAHVPPKRFHGSVQLDVARVSRDAGRIAEEVVQHLSVLKDANVEVTLEIHANIPEGTPDNVVRTVTENCRTLKFTQHGFEEE